MMTTGRAFPRRRAARQRGAGALLAMMFLVIFSSLAAAMAIVSQGNLRTADIHLKVNRALSASQTGLEFITFQLGQAALQVRTRDGVIDNTNAADLWDQTAQVLVTTLATHAHNQQAPYILDRAAYIGPIQVGPFAPSFTATLTPHPIPGEDYDSERYQQEPYASMSPPVSNSAPLDARFVRVEVVATDGTVGSGVSRSVSMDFRIDKKLRYALLSRSRVMIGRNVMIRGPVGSRFTETHLTNGHPIQVESDFRGMASALDDALDALIGTLVTNDVDGDNRLNIYNPAEVDGLNDPASFDTSGDGYIDDYDFFLSHFDANGDAVVSATELDAQNSINAAQLLGLIDTFGDPARAGYGDGVIDESDRYAKIRGEVHLTATQQAWIDGAAGGIYQDFLQGPIHPGFGESALTFGSTQNNAYEFGPADFDVSTFRNMATNDVFNVAASQVGDPADPDDPHYSASGMTESVPFGAAYPYDFYDRPVFENMTFTNVTIPKGTNALFRNCRFIGVTFVETATDNNHENFNYAGMQDGSGQPKHPDKSAVVGGQTVEDTKAVSNNLRFHDCTFEGAVVTDAPQQFTHTRNKLAFTGRTDFEIDGSSALSESEKNLFRRSTILAPHYSVEMGTFADPGNSNEQVELSGTIVAGLIDMRGNIKVNGSIVTTFEPQSNTNPVIGETSPQFNTTLGYFSSAAGDLEAELPVNGLGAIQVTYDPTLPLPDGILGPIEVRPITLTYREGGK